MTATWEKISFFDIINNAKICICWIVRHNWKNTLKHYITIIFNISFLHDVIYLLLSTSPEGCIPLSIKKFILLKLYNDSLIHVCDRCKTFRFGPPRTQLLYWLQTYRKTIIKQNVKYHHGLCDLGVFYQLEHIPLCHQVMNIWWYILPSTWSMFTITHCHIVEIPHCSCHS